jgi:aryl-alcohol dehydrogenase-like predicted oxidoreductase
MGGPRVNAEAIRSDVEDELQRLGTDYLDAWSFHRDQPGVDVRPLVDELHKLKEEGKIRCYGASNWTLPRQESFNRQAAWRGAAPLAFNNPNYCLAVPNEQMWGDSHTLESSEEAWHITRQIPLVSWSAAAAGWFAGVEAPDVRRVYANPENELRRARVREIAKQRGASPVQVALAWVLNAPFPTWAIIGADRPEHFVEAAGACDLELSAEDRAWLETGK